MKLLYCLVFRGGHPSHSARSAWIETPAPSNLNPYRNSRTPQGVRGLKLESEAGRPVAYCRTPQGVRGLKLESEAGRPVAYCRTPQGVRGLKLCDVWGGVAR